MFERFTDRARRCMQLANQEALRLNHEYIGTEHILLGLVAEGSGVAANVLKDYVIDLALIRRETEKLVQVGPEPIIMGKLPQTPRAKKVIEYSMEEARNLNHNYVGTEHILLGLLREQEGTAAQVLMNLGLTVDVVREAVVKHVVGAGNRRLVNAVKTQDEWKWRICAIEPSDDGSRVKIMYRRGDSLSSLTTEVIAPDDATEPEILRRLAWFNQRHAATAAVCEGLQHLVNKE